jgi:alanine-synthesizing transaminase
MDFTDLDLGLSSRLTNRIYELHGRLEAAGEPVIDLISGSVSSAGLFFPESTLQHILLESWPRIRHYHPDSLGQESARVAIASYYRAQGVDFSPSQILLTTGTSLSYLYCFRLLAEAGDEIICPTPAYPLFDLIARVCQVNLISYRLREDQGWRIDLDYLESRLTTRTRAIVLISPHNPTGMVANEAELREIAEIATRHQLAIIADEVFSEFFYSPFRLPRPAGTQAPLVFTLNGFSKMFALPGMKLGWIVVSGEPTRVEGALRTLELISDTFLPVNELIQFSVPAIFEKGSEFLESYRKKIRQCRDAAMDAFSRADEFSYVPPEGGFYLSLRIRDQRVDEEDLILNLLETSHVLVHPGYFYEMRSPHLILTFTQEEPVLRTALNRIIQTVSAGRNHH